MGAGGASVPIIGGMFQAFGALEEAQERAWALEDEAKVARKNAKLTREAGKFNSEKQWREAEKAFGATKADYAASGISQDSGSVLEVLRASYASAEMDRLNILYGSEMQAQDLDQKASAADEGADTAKKLGQFNAFAALFGAGARAASYDTGSSSSNSTPSGGTRSPFGG